MRNWHGNLSPLGRWHGGRNSAFSPASLFATGEAGVWYDPSDLTAMFQDTAGTIPVTTAGQTVAMTLDKSGNDNHATQATAAARPTYGYHPKGGRRNLLTQTEGFDNADWSKIVATVTANAAVAPSGTSTADRLSTGTGGGTSFSRVVQSVTTDLSSDQSATIYAKADTASWLFLQMGAFTSPASGGVYFGLANGVVGAADAGFSGHIQSVGDGWYRCEVRWATGASDAEGQFQVFVTDAGGSANATQDGRSIFIWGAQLEVGSTATDYQRVGNEYDVTEAGVPSVHYLFDDGIDYSLPATIPDLGTNATMAYATDAGTTILTGQTIGAGTFDALRGTRTYAVIAVNRALTESELTGVTAYLDAARGAA